MIRPSILRASLWLISLTVIHIVLAIFWSGKLPSCSYSTASTLITVLFLQRAALEVYRSQFTPSTSSKDDGGTSSFRQHRLFRGRSALWIRFAFGLFLLMTALLSVVQGASEVFLFEVTLPTLHNQQNNVNHQQQQQQQHKQQSQNRAKVPARHSTPNYNRYSSQVDTSHDDPQNDGGDAQQFVQSQPQRGNNDGGFTPGGIDPYEVMLHIEPLCPLSTSFISSLLIWVVHCATVLLCGSVLSSNRSSRRAKSNNNNNNHQNATTPQQHNQQGGEVPVWALTIDPLNELKIASFMCVASLLMHWAAHTWMLDPVKELSAYLSFLGGGVVLFYEGFNCVAVVSALTMALSEREANLVAQLEKAIERDLDEFVVVPPTTRGDNDRDGVEQKQDVVSPGKTLLQTEQQQDASNSSDHSRLTSPGSLRLSAFKTHMGTLCLVVDCCVIRDDDAAAVGVGAAGDDDDDRHAVAVAEKIRSVIRTNATWERVFDRFQMKVRCS